MDREYNPGHLKWFNLSCHKRNTILFRSNWREVQSSSLNPLPWQDWSWTWGTVNVPTPVLLSGLEIPPWHLLSPEGCDELSLPAPEACMGSLHPLNFSACEKPMDSKETEMSVLVLQNFRAGSTLKSTLAQSTARLHICRLLVAFIPNMFQLQEKYSVSFPAWCSGRSSLGSERQKVWKRYEKSILPCCLTDARKQCPCMDHRCKVSIE